MKKIILQTAAIVIYGLQTVYGQYNIYPLKKDVSTIDGIMSATYDVVSGEAGVVRDWKRDLSLHHPNAVYSFQDEVKGKLHQVTMSINDFHKQTDTAVAKTAFYESEINKEIRVFGNIAHVWSTYETRLVKNGPVVRRGINSVQLFFADKRWWIISWTFDKERGDRKIPQTFDKN